VAHSQMVSVSASINLPLHHKVQKFSSGTGSPGWSRKKAVKRLWYIIGRVELSLSWMSGSWFVCDLICPWVACLQIGLSWDVQLPCTVSEMWNVFQMSSIVNSSVKTEDHLELVYSDGVLCGKSLVNSTIFIDSSLCLTHHVNASCGVNVGYPLIYLNSEGWLVHYSCYGWNLLDAIPDDSRGRHSLDIFIDWPMISLPLCQLAGIITQLWLEDPASRLMSTVNLCMKPVDVVFLQVAEMNMDHTTSHWLMDKVCNISTVLWLCWRTQGDVKIKLFCICILLLHANIHFFSCQNLITKCCVMYYFSKWLEARHQPAQHCANEL